MNTDKVLAIKFYNWSICSNIKANEATRKRKLLGVDLLYSIILIYTLYTPCTTGTTNADVFALLITNFYALNSEIYDVYIY